MTDFTKLSYSHVSIELSCDHKQVLSHLERTKIKCVNCGSFAASPVLLTCKRGLLCTFCHRESSHCPFCNDQECISSSIDHSLFKLLNQVQIQCPSSCGSDIPLPDVMQHLLACPRSTTRTRNTRTEITRFLTKINREYPEPARVGQQVAVFVGLPAAGKSTLYRSRYRDRGFIRINQDELKKRSNCINMMVAAIISGRPMVIDRCNLSREQRSPWLLLARRRHLPISAIWLRTPLPLCRRLNRWRGVQGGRVVPNVAYKRLGMCVEKPTQTEGFDAVLTWDIRKSLPMDKLKADLQEHIPQGKKKKRHGKK
eukprot:gnl/Dysnectes_brevis/6429_a9969_253.p1 GENE.gnl/Dysnectes_brevis/6429_a9969_253~~gnl/Dysnectes_brevis/6429_a9969_253.p1  ORF type:complete len:312 (-),score=65.25 gnl/Dysnectes_brevis/6429_a9969_253:46-981(-)